MDTAIDRKTTQFLKSFYLRFNLFTEGFSFFIVVPIVLFYVWANIQLTNDQLLLFFKIVPPAFLFGIAFVLANNRIAVLPILRYFKKLVRGETVPTKYTPGRKNGCSISRSFTRSAPFSAG